MAWAQSHDGKLGLDSASTQSTSFQPDSSSSEQTRPRSPHTYRRANSDHHDVQPSKADPLQNGRLMSSGYNRKWARTPRTSSDSGTDADDERTGLLKGLPAAPARPRKGLRVQHAAESDNEEVVLWPPSRSSWALFFRSPSPKPLKTNNATSSSYDSNSMTRRVTVRRRHAGVVHRLIETALLGSVAGIVFLREDVRSLALSWRRGKLASIPVDAVLDSIQLTVIPFQDFAHISRCSLSFTPPAPFACHFGAAVGRVFLSHLRYPPASTQLRCYIRL